MKYYRLENELYYPEDRWFLNGLNVVASNTVSVWEFVKAQKLMLPDGQVLKIKQREKGTPIDFTFADFDVIIVNEKVAFLLEDEECQLFPVEVEGVKLHHSYFVVILQKSIDCLDETRSEFEKWQPNNPIRPDKAGHYKIIYKMHVNPAKIDNTSIFRLNKYDVVVIVNEKLKNKLEKNGITGIKFKDVS